jgi:hypothetical protein
MNLTLVKQRRFQRHNQVPLSAQVSRQALRAFLDRREA